MFNRIKITGALVILLGLAGMLGTFDYATQNIEKDWMFMAVLDRTNMELYNPSSYSPDTYGTDRPVFDVNKDMQSVLTDDVKKQLKGVTTSNSLIAVIMGWIKFLLPYAGVIAFGAIVYAGFLYLTGFAQEENIEKAKKILLWSIMGLILIFSAYSIVSTFLSPAG